MNMKTNLSSFQAIAAATVMAMATISTSCSKSDAINDTEPVQAAVNILPTVSNATAATRADAAYTTGTIFLHYGSVASGTDAEFTHNGTAWTSAAPLYWDNLTADATNYNFFALAPAVPVVAPAVAADQSADGYASSDQLVAYATTTERRDALPLTFKHVLSQIKVTVTATPAAGQAGYLDPSDATLAIAGAKTGYTLAYADPTAAIPAVATVATATATITPNTLVNDAAASKISESFLAIIPAQSIAAEALVFTFTINGRTYTWKNSIEVKTVAGQTMNFAIVVSQSGVTLDANGITLTDWSSVNFPGDGGVVID